jgi:hypothetical protein
MRAQSSTGIGGASPRPHPAAAADPSLPSLARMFQMASSLPAGTAASTQRAPPSIVVRAPPLPPQLALPAHKNAPVFPTYAAHGPLFSASSSSSSSSFLAAAGVGSTAAVAAAARIGETAFSSEEAFRAWLDAPDARTPSGKHPRQPPQHAQQRSATATPSRHSSSSSSHDGTDASLFAATHAASVYSTPSKALAGPFVRAGAGTEPPPSPFPTSSIAAAAPSQTAPVHPSDPGALAAAASNAAFAFGASAFRTNERDAIGAIDRELNLAMHEAVDEYVVAMDEAAISARDAGAFALGAAENADRVQTPQQRHDMDMDGEEESSASVGADDYDDNEDAASAATPLAGSSSVVTPRRRPASHALLRLAANGNRSTVSFNMLPSSVRRADAHNAAMPIAAMATPSTAARSKSAMANTPTLSSSLTGLLTLESSSARSPAVSHAAVFTSPSSASSSSSSLSSVGDANIAAALRLAQSQHAALDAALGRLQQVWDAADYFVSCAQLAHGFCSADSHRVATLRFCWLPLVCPQLGARECRERGALISRLRGGFRSLLHGVGVIGMNANYNVGSVRALSDLHEAEGWTSRLEGADAHAAAISASVTTTTTTTTTTVTSTLTSVSPRGATDLVASSSSSSSSTALASPPPPPGILHLLRRLHADAIAQRRRRARLTALVNAERRRADGLQIEVDSYLPRAQQHRADLRAKEERLEQLRSRAQT